MQIRRNVVVAAVVVMVTALGCSGPDNARAPRPPATQAAAATAVQAAPTAPAPASPTAAASPTALASPAAVATPTLAATPTALANPTPAVAKPTPVASPTPEPRAFDDAWSGPAGPIKRNAAPPAADASTTPLAALARAEAAFDAGKPREALDALEAGPLPAEVGDLVALRRAELAFNLGDRARARAELAKPELSESDNRILIVRAAELADRLGDHGAAAGLWLRSTRYFNWTPERAHALASAAFDFARLDRPERAGEMLALIAEIQTKLPAASKELAPLASLSSYHAGVIAAIGGDKVTAAQHLRRYLAERPSGQYAAAAQKRLAALDRPAVDLAWIAARDADTVASYRSWAAAYPNDPRVPDARFFVGLVQYRAGQYPLALETWKGWTSPSVEAEVRARAIYWTGRAYEALGQPDVARLRWQEAAAVTPISFYSLRARDRLNGVLGWPDAGGALRPAAPTAAEEAEVAEWIAGWAGPAKDPSAADAAALHRASLFAALGLARTADAELYRLIQSTEDPHLLYRAGRLAQEGGSWMASLRAGLRLGAMSPGKTSVDAPVGVRLLSYPMAYRDDVQSAAERRDLGPLLLLSLMRKESLFDHFAYSPAEARGLTQVIPSTGSQVARDLGLASFQPEELFDPKRSIAFGSYHLADRIKLFKGDVFRAVASYNAGPEAVAKWAPGSDDPDIFVEAIDFRETRGYVKSIYEYQSIYRGVLATSGGRA